jgi:hypothetical protein
MHINSKLWFNWHRGIVYYSEVIGWAGGVAEMVKCEALSSNSSATKKRKKKTNRSH